MEYFLGVISIFHYNADFGSKIEKNRREDDFADPLFFGFRLQTQVETEFSTLVFFSLKVEGICQGLSWSDWLYHSTVWICAGYRPHPLPRSGLSVSAFILCQMESQIRCIVRLVRIDI